MHRLEKNKETIDSISMDFSKLTANELIDKVKENDSSCIEKVAEWLTVEKFNAEQFRQLLEISILENHLSIVKAIIQIKKTIIDENLYEGKSAFQLALMYHKHKIAVLLYQANPSLFQKYWEDFQPLADVIVKPRSAGIRTTKTFKNLSQVILKEKNTRNKKLLLSLLKDSKSGIALIPSIVKVCSFEEFLSLLKEMYKWNFNYSSNMILSKFIAPAAVRFGRLDILEHLLKNSREKMIELDASTIQYLAMHNDIKTLRWLYQPTLLLRICDIMPSQNENDLESKPDSKNILSQILLGLVIRERLVKLAEFAITRQLDFSIKQEALCFAIKSGHLEIVKIFVNNLFGFFSKNHKNAKVTVTALYHNQFEILKFLISERFPFSPEMKIKKNLTPLMIAAKNNNAQMFGYVLNLIKKEDLTTQLALKDGDGNTFAHIAALCGNTEILEKLNQFAFDFSQANNKGVTPLVSAIQNNELAAVNFLIKRAALPPFNMRQLDLTHLFMEALSYNADEVVRFFILERNIKPEALAMLRLPYFRTLLSNIFILLLAHSVGTLTDKINLLKNYIEDKNTGPLIADLKQAKTTNPSLIPLYTYLKPHKALSIYEALLKKEDYETFSQITSTTIEVDDHPANYITRCYLARKIFIENLYIEEEGSPLNIKHMSERDEDWTLDREGLILRALKAYDLMEGSTHPHKGAQTLLNPINRVLSTGANSPAAREQVGKVFHRCDWLPGVEELYQKYLLFKAQEKISENLDSLPKSQKKDCRLSAFQGRLLKAEPAPSFLNSLYQGHLTAQIEVNLGKIQIFSDNRMILKNIAKTIAHFLTGKNLPYQADMSDEKHPDRLEIEVENDENMSLSANILRELGIAVTEPSTTLKM